MPDRDIRVPWPAWVFVTLSAAVLSGPLATELIQQKNRDAAPSALVAPRAERADRPLTLQDLAGKSRWELDVLRNEIYARHGRRFSRGDLQQYFSSQPWYVPRYAPGEFPEGLLSEVERSNAELIAEYQRRTFGR